MDLAARLETYVAARLPHAEGVTVANLDRIFGGGSRETYRFAVCYREAGREVSRRLILRRDPPASLIETERRIEFAAYRAFYGTRVPVPEPLWLEEDPRHLDHARFATVTASAREPAGEVQVQRSATGSVAHARMGVTDRAAIRSVRRSPPPRGIGSHVASHCRPNRQ